MADPVQAGRGRPQQDPTAPGAHVRRGRLADLAAHTRCLALVGLAKNTGKTVALGAILRELEKDGRRVGVTSVGRDGEERDVIDIRIEKPPVRLAAGSLVASTDSLMRESGVLFELLADTGIRTPLGTVQIARLLQGGTIEVAGPSAAEDVRAVSEQMLAHGAEQVLIDGAIDRRAASSPAVSDGLIMSTGAALGEDIEQVVSQTRAAVELVNLPIVEDRWLDTLVREHREDLLIDRQGEPVVLPFGFALSAGEQEIARVLRENAGARGLLVQGALCEPFLQGLAGALKGSQLDVVVRDTTRVFLSDRPLRFYRGHGLNILALRRVNLLAVTVNPIFPGAHSFDSERLVGMIEQAIPGVPVLDVLSPAYIAAATA